MWQFWKNYYSAAGTFQGILPFVGQQIKENPEEGLTAQESLDYFMISFRNNEVYVLFLFY